VPRRVSPLLPATIGAVAVLLAAPASVMPAVASAPAPAIAPVRSVTITGTGVTTFPAYDATLDRFAVRTTTSTNGAIQVTATSTDPAATVRLDGRPVAAGTPAPVSGLVPGDEVNVQVTDAAGTSDQSFIYLPPGFPTLSATSGGAGPSPGHVFLTLSAFFSSDRFEAVVDDHGVPSYVRSTLNPEDLKLQPNGHYSVARGRTDALDSTFDIVELDQTFTPVASHTTKNLTNTEFHDSILLPGGGRILMAYEPNSGKVDSVVEEVNAAGSVVFTWNSEDHTIASDGLTSLADYAHLNSIELMHDGNLLLSFRHLSQVMKVNRTTGAVMWRLGGKRSTFTFPDDPMGGSCAQHTARELANGDIQIFDNGSRITSTTPQALCPDPSNPTGPRITRPSSRVTVYHLDEAAGTATLVKETPTGGFSEFAGSAQRLGTGTLADNVFIGHSLETATGADTTPSPVIASETTAAGATVWSLSASDGFFSYRSLKFPGPDAIAPRITAVTPAAGAVYDEGQVPAADFACTDTGGSNLDACTGSTPNGAALDGSPGQHVLTVVAADRAGNRVTMTMPYMVRAAYLPDAQVRRHHGRFVGVGVYGPAKHQRATLRTSSYAGKRFQLRIVNRGAQSDRMTVTGVGGNRFGTVRFFAGRRDVTRQVLNGSYRTPTLAPGAAATLTVELRRLRSAPADTHLTSRIRVLSAGDSSRDDAVAVALRAPKR
jgi:hypothetical protein